jgi:glycosyltransferase involved in cell wall biosynthesis
VKVLHVIISLNVGGAELILKRLISLHINNPHYSHTVVSLRDIGVVGQQLRDLGVEVFTLGLNSVFQLPQVFFRLVKLIRYCRPDIVQTWMYHADLVGGLAARLAGCRKVIWGIRNTDLYSGSGVSQSTGLVMKLCAILSDFVPHTILCVGHRAKAAHISAGYIQSKMTVISNGFDIETYKSDSSIRHSIRQSLGVPSNILIIGSIGRFNEYKDHRGFILALRSLASVESRVHFLMVGRDINSDNSTLMKWIEETGYMDRFILLGERNDVPAILNAMDIFCLHSKSEGFPNVLGEAMCVGLPSVVTDVGDAALLVGNSGLVVPVQDTESLIEGLLTLVKYTAENRARLGKIARNRINENYSIESVKHQYEELYHRVMSA